MTADGYRVLLIGVQLLLLTWILLHDLRTLIVQHRYVYPAVAG